MGLKYRVSKYLRSNYFSWKYIINNNASKNFIYKNLNDEHQRILDELNLNGIAFSNFESIFQDISFSDFVYIGPPRVA